MSTQTTNYLDIIERLPAGALLRLQNVSWDDYEHLLTQMESYRPGRRLSYDCGRLTVMSPSTEHEDYKDSIYSMVRVMSLELGVTLETRGTATFKSKLLKKGLEPDACFYVQNAAHVIGKRRINLDVDPPPDVVVEVDTTNESLPKFPIYVALGVPEIWRYDGQRVYFYKLAGENYELMQDSLAFPNFSTQDLTQYMEQSKAEGQTAALLALMKMLRARASS
jgi:Uma2 family endonuclease